MVVSICKHMQTWFIKLGKHLQNTYRHLQNTYKTLTNNDNKCNRMQTHASDCVTYRKRHFTCKWAVIYKCVYTTYTTYMLYLQHLQHLYLVLTALENFTYMYPNLLITCKRGPTFQQGALAKNLKNGDSDA